MAELPEDDQADRIAAREAIADAKKNGAMPWEQIRAELGLPAAAVRCDRCGETSCHIEWKDRMCLRWNDRGGICRGFFKEEAATDG